MCSEGGDIAAGTTTRSHAERRSGENGRGQDKDETNEGQAAASVSDMGAEKKKKWIARAGRRCRRTRGWREDVR